MNWKSPRCSSACWDEIKEHDAAHAKAVQALIDMRRDRDEWKQQHENLLAIYQALVAQQAAEPVAWIVIAKETDNVRIWWRQKDQTEAWAATHNAPVIPLYAHPLHVDAVLPLAHPPRQPAAGREELLAMFVRRFPETFTPYGDGKAPSAFAAQVADEVLSLLAAPQQGTGEVREATRLCSCKASQRDGQHMMWCASISDRALSDQCAGILRKPGEPE